jgi:hypothetical protein
MNIRSRTGAADIKSRFAELFAKHLKQWEGRNPKPELPSLDVVTRELKAGKVVIDAKALAVELKPQDRWGDEQMPSLGDAVETASMARYSEELKARKAKLSAFTELLTEARDNYQDRVLFDHENAYVLLRDVLAGLVRTC